MLVGLLISACVLAMVYQQMQSLGIQNVANSNTTQSAADNRSAIDTMADHVRNACACDGSAGTANSVIDTATATSFTYYSGTTCAKVTYSLSGTNLMRTVGTGTPSIVARNISALTFTYYEALTYNSSWGACGGSTRAASLPACTSANAPTSAELPYICGILIDATTSVDGQITHATTTVRLRNAPRKGNLDGS